jgi:hypothetical protein
MPIYYMEANMYAVLHIPTGQMLFRHYETNPWSAVSYIPVYSIGSIEDSQTPVLFEVNPIGTRFFKHIATELNEFVDCFEVIDLATI